MSASQRINGILRKIPSWPIYLLGPIPGFWVFWLAVQDRLGADPLQVLEHELGERGLQFLVLTLLVTPVRRISGVSLLKFRRAIGLVAFFYIMAHLLTWFVLDRQLDLPDIWREIVKRPFITIGMAGFLAMVPLAITSNNRSIRKMGAATWSKLHRLAYVAAFAGAAHYLLLVKSWPLEPIIYALVVAALLAIRAWWAAQRRIARRWRAS